MSYRKGANADFPNSRCWDHEAENRRRKAEQATLSEVAKDLEKQGVLIEAELEGLLKSDYSTYWQRKNELKRK